MMAARQPAAEAFVLRRSYRVPPPAVWRAWVDAAVLRVWFDPVVDPRERDAWRADFKRLDALLQNSRQT